MTTDLSLLVPLRTGAFLFSELWKYCAKVKGINLLNQYFDSHFHQNAGKVTSYLSLSAYLNSLSTAKQGEMLSNNRGSFELNDHHVQELLESYQKLKRQFDGSVFHYAILVNFE